MRLIDAREIRTVKGLRYFYIFEGETRLVERVGPWKALAFGLPPGCFLQAEVRRQPDCYPRLSLLVISLENLYQSTIIASRKNLHVDFK